MARFICAVALTGLVALGACGGDAAPVATPATTAATRPAVTVKDFAFGPKELTVAKGATVTWTNKDDFDHSVVITDLGVDGTKFGPVTMPLTFTHTFDAAGTYPYMCGVHNSMTGTVVVTS